MSLRRWVRIRHDRADDGTLIHGWEGALYFLNEAPGLSPYWQQVGTIWEPFWPDAIKRGLEYVQTGDA